MKKNIFFACLCCMLIVLASCEKKDKETQLGSIWGVITDLTTGNPVQGAQVQLQPTGATAQTGSDGAYEFPDIEDGKYTLKVNKAGYSDLIDDYIITVKNGRRVKRDVQIEKLTPQIIVKDDNGNDVTELDFGDNPADVIRSFFIFNKGEETLKWSIEYKCQWIGSINKTSGELKSNEPQPLKVTIDRNKLNVGENSTTIHILANGGTKQITVYATRTSVIETLPASEEQAHSAVLNGRIIQDLSPSITEYGFVYNKSGAPTTENATIVKMPSLPSIGAPYNALISNLEVQTWYYARAYATNGETTVYGDDVRFLTEEGKPLVETTGITNVTSSSAKIQCDVKNDGGSEITERGVCYGLKPEPNRDDDSYSFVKDKGVGVGPYECLLTDLLPNAHYYARAYAKSKAGRIGYGVQKEFDTNDGLAIVVIGEVSSITSNSAICSAQVISDGGRQVTERGICWSTTHNPTIDKYKKVNGLTGTGQYTCTMENLQPGTTYYVRAYAINSASPVEYSEEERRFTTYATKPVVTTQGVSNITSSSATVSGNISSTGGAAITEAGFKYQAEGEYSWQSERVQVTSGTFSYQLTNLNPNTKYYVKAYAKNSEGISEGSVVNFTTKSGSPQVSTVSSSNVSSQSATVTGKIISDGGFPIQECGICYSSTNSKPTISDEHVVSDAKSGQFNCNLTGLTPSTKYYARAYAKNANGIVYDYTSINFKTKNGMPAITITKQPTYNGNNATIYGRITDDGGANIEYYGVVYSRSSSSPSIDDREAIQYEEGAPTTNDFTFSVTIPSGTMINYRLFVVNSLGNVAYSSSGYLLTY